MESGQDKYLTVDHCSIRYREAGNGPVLLLVHGIAGFLEEWEPSMEILSKSFRVIALDLPGHGLSSRPDIPYTMDCLADFLKGFILAMNPGKVYLAGHSLGGAVCLNVTIKHPHLVERLVLLNSAYVKIPFSIRLGSFTFLPKLIRRIPFFIVKASARNTFYNHRRITESWLKDAWRYTNEPGSLRAMFSIIHSNLCLSGLRKPILNYYLKECRQIELPTLILYGERDRIIPNMNSKLLHRHMANSECVSFQDCGHELQVECCKQFCEQVMKFLK